MHTLDPGDPAATDIVDGGDTASPPADSFDSFHVLEPQAATGAITPTFVGVDVNEAVKPGAGLTLYVRVNATVTTVAVQVPGTQPYTAAARDNLTVAGLQNTERVFYMPDLVVDPDTEVAVVTFDQTVGVTAALIQVN